MYPVAWRTFSANYPLFLIAALAFAGIEAAGFEMNGGVSVAICGLIALYSHRMVLLNENYGWTGKPDLLPGERMPVWAFFWRYGLFFVVLMILVLGTFFKMLPNGSPDEAKRVFGIMLSMLIISPFFAVFLTLFGTVMPAAAVGGDRSFCRAFYRGRKRFWTTIIRLILGPGFITVLNFILAVLLASIGISAVANFISSFLLNFVSFIPVHLTAVVLSLAYREAEVA